MISKTVRCSRIALFLSRTVGLQKMIRNWTFIKLVFLKNNLLHWVYARGFQLQHFLLQVKFCQPTDFVGMKRSWYICCPKTGFYEEFLWHKGCSYALALHYALFEFGKKGDILTVFQRKPCCVKQNTFASGEGALKFAQVVNHLVTKWNGGFIYNAKHKPIIQSSPYKLPHEKRWFELRWSRENLMNLIIGTKGNWLLCALIWRWEVSWQPNFHKAWIKPGN